MRKKIIWLLAIILGTTTIAYGALPGKHRALTPNLFDMVEIAPNLWIDQPSLAASTIALVEDARARSAAFYGKILSNPTYIICTQQLCAKTFGMTTRGLTYGAEAVFIGPMGINATIIFHEQIHADLHSYMGVTDIFTQRYPAWFNEGLATYLSKDDRVTRPETIVEAQWIREAQTFSDWGRMTRRDNWRKTYGAAARLVEALDAEIGPLGLRQLINQVAKGQNFEEALQEIAGNTLR